MPMSRRDPTFRRARHRHARRHHGARSPATVARAQSLLSAAGADLPFARASQERKQAYAAAEAGLEYYMFKLSQFNDYWTLCDNGPARARPSRTRSTSTGTGPAPTRAAGARWPTAKSAVHDRAAPGRPAPRAPRRGSAARRRCSTRVSGTFRIRATGPLRRRRRARSSRRCGGARSSTSSTSPTTRRATRRSTRDPDDAAVGGGELREAAREPPRRLRADPVRLQRTRSTGRCTRTTTC